MFRQIFYIFVINFSMLWPLLVFLAAFPYKLIHCALVRTVVTDPIFSSSPNNVQVSTYDVVRCYNCKDIGYMETYSFLPPKFAKCSGDHESGNHVCPARSQDQFWCINCGSNHRAGYLKCQAFLEVVANLEQPKTTFN